MGIGKEIALALGKEGALVVAGYRSNADGAQDTVGRVESGGGKAVAVWASTCAWFTEVHQG